MALTVTTGVATEMFSKISFVYDIGSKRGVLSFKSRTLQYTVRVLERAGWPASWACTTRM